MTVFDIVPRLLGREDSDAAEVIRDVFEREEIALALGAKPTLIRSDGNEKVIDFELNDEERELRVDEILVAVAARRLDGFQILKIYIWKQQVLSITKRV